MIEHEVPWHERMSCTQCQREFWGDCAYRTHMPCGKTEMRGKFHKDGELYVLKGEVNEYAKIKTLMRKAREGKRK